MLGLRKSRDFSSLYRRRILNKPDPPPLHFVPYYRIQRLHFTVLYILHRTNSFGSLHITLYSTFEPGTKISLTLVFNNTFQSKMLRIISSVPWYVSNQTLHSDFDIQYVTEVVRINANKYKNRSTEHSNQLIRALFSPTVDRRLKRLWPEDLAQ